VGGLAGGEGEGEEAKLALIRSVSRTRRRASCEEVVDVVRLCAVWFGDCFILIGGIEDMVSFCVVGAWRWEVGGIY